MSDVSDRTITLLEPKSGEVERAYMPENVSKKLAEYIKENALDREARIFPICYSTARSLVRGLRAKLNDPEENSCLRSELELIVLLKVGMTI